MLAARRVGAAAADIIDLFALAIRQGSSPQAPRRAHFAYPTAASGIGCML
jgi:pyruvate/2-oxoglutarate dehydrogenase complex dihydrolipoamide dehydrogenase (E3) component